LTPDGPIELAVADMRGADGHQQGAEKALPVKVANQKATKFQPLRTKLLDYIIVLVGKRKKNYFVKPFPSHIKPHTNSISPMEH
jgi:hypothetical protein